MPKRLLDYDPATGVSTYHEYNHQNKTTTIGYSQNVESILSLNKEMAKDLDRGYTSADKTMRRVASIPVVVQLQWLKEGLDLYNKDHWSGIAKKLNDPDWRYLRTAPGRV